ncbi:SWI/SNF-related matrix-associated actin-dependent regulator of chromatin subfamily A containing DEAD/H box 1-like [Stylophora pistillata]|uniref:SWI/SNF-related matrix-associated actin-dependent regulator of chromatin subfamily A containing DEAD/H box 1-like n=1 Tax=Stylophora pistillata TaxID=50429 RepID=UPI000C053F89|nr:SWI/SNF-related matrix-associated actin-dependent regulator of chromatin subfamily A containing DEAD/H box 1-like [Stylophora pistillata]
MEQWNVENMSLSEFNLDKFSYQRKLLASARDHTGISSQPCASTNRFTLNSQSAHSSRSGRKSKDSLSNCHSNEEDNGLGSCADDSSSTAAIVADQEPLDVMETQPSETRVQVVDALNSSKENVNPDKDHIVSFKAGNKRKRHFFMEDEDDGDNNKDKKRSCKSEELGGLDTNCNSRKNSTRRDVTYGKKEIPEVVCLSSDEADDSDVVITDFIDISQIDMENDSEDDSLSKEEMVTMLSFFNDCTVQELAAVPGLSSKKAEKIIKMRPFESWTDLVSKLDSAKNLSSELIDNCQSLLEERKAVEKLMNKCENISNKIQDMLNSRLSVDKNDSSNSKRGAVITSQPKILNKSLQLKPYQLTSLNWLVLMHEQGVNGILADEMGLGKTVQAIAFLAHLCESGEKGPHLIIVPASTLDNWCREAKKWCPSLEFFLYYGSQAERLQLQCEVDLTERKPDIFITTYTVATGTKDDRSFLRKLNCNYVVLDEGHMLKNMQSQRYQGLMKMKARRRLLLTGTPLQNNLLELMSLLSFVMPSMFGDSVQGIKMLFSNSKMNGEPGSNYQKATVAQAKRIMKPFVLRRLKKDVLQQLPAKHDLIVKVDLTEEQRQLYNYNFVNCSRQFKESDGGSQYSNILMLLRKAANHPLLLRNRFNDSILLKMAKKYCKDPAHRDCEPDLVFEDMTVMSDFELHCLCREEQSLADHCLSKEIMMKSGKFEYLDTLLPELKQKNCRLLLFSQFTMMMDIIEVYLSNRSHRYLRLDGKTAVVDRQNLIDEFNGDPDIFVFLLSTKAGGLGINLTAANVVILHDVDFNPYNDKQAEDRCHRVGQTRSVTVYRLIAKNTVEEAILQCAQTKLRLEQDMALADDTKSAKDVSELLKDVFSSS